MIIADICGRNKSFDLENCLFVLRDDRGDDLLHMLEVSSIGDEHNLE